MPIWPISLYFLYTVNDLADQSWGGCHPYSNCSFLSGIHIKEMTDDSTHQCFSTVAQSDKVLWGWLINSTLLYVTRCTFQIGRISAYMAHIAIFCVYCIRLGGPIIGGLPSIFSLQPFGNSHQGYDWAFRPTNASIQ